MYSLKYSDFYSENIPFIHCTYFPCIFSQLWEGTQRNLAFQIFGRSNLWAPLFTSVGERFSTKKYCPDSLLSVVSKILEKFVNNSLVDHLKKYILFSNFLYVSRSSQSTANLLTVVSCRTVRAFSWSGAAGAAVFDISNAFGKCWHAGLLHKYKSCRISGWVFDNILWFCLR